MRPFLNNHERQVQDSTRCRYIVAFLVLACPSAGRQIILRQLGHLFAFQGLADTAVHAAFGKGARDLIEFGNSGVDSVAVGASDGIA